MSEEVLTVVGKAMFSQDEKRLKEYLYGIEHWLSEMDRSERAFFSVLTSFLCNLFLKSYSHLGSADFSKESYFQRLEILENPNVERLKELAKESQRTASHDQDNHLLHIIKEFAKELCQEADYTKKAMSAAD